MDNLKGKAVYTYIQLLYERPTVIVPFCHLSYDWRFSNLPQTQCHSLIRKTLYQLFSTYVGISYFLHHVLSHQLCIIRPRHLYSLFCELKAFKIQILHLQTHFTSNILLSLEMSISLNQNFTPKGQPRVHISRCYYLKNL